MNNQQNSNSQQNNQFMFGDVEEIHKELSRDFYEKLENSREKFIQKMEQTRMEFFHKTRQIRDEFDEKLEEKYLITKKADSEPGEGKKQASIEYTESLEKSLIKFLENTDEIEIEKTQLEKISENLVVAEDPFLKDEERRKIYFKMYDDIGCDIYDPKPVAKKLYMRYIKSLLENSGYQIERVREDLEH